MYRNCLALEVGWVVHSIAISLAHVTNMLCLMQLFFMQWFSSVRSIYFRLVISVHTNLVEIQYTYDLSAVLSCYKDMRESDIII